MLGNNVIIANQATMIAAFQCYLDKMMATNAPETIVTSVKSHSGSGSGGLGKFEIEIKTPTPEDDTPIVRQRGD